MKSDDILNIKDSVILYADEDDAFFIANKLHSIGYTFYRFNDIRELSRRWDSFVPAEDYDFVNGRSSSVSFNDNKKISSEEIINMIGDVEKSRFVKIKRLDIDPYDEENWGWKEIKENSKFKLPIGTRVIVSGWYDLVRFRNKIGIVIGYYQRSDRLVLVKFDEIFYPNDNTYQHNGNQREDPTKRSRYFNIDEIKPIDEEMVKEIKRKKEEIERKKEEMRLKMLDVDPYSEENWNESVHQNILTFKQWLN